MGKKKTKKVSNRNLVVIGLISIIALACLAIILGVILKSCNERESEPYYECTNYQWSWTKYEDGQTKVVTDDYLSSYKYYRVILHDDNTLTLKYKLKETDQKGEIKGTYTTSKDGGTVKVKMTFNDTNDFQTLLQEVEFTSNDAEQTLVSEQRGQLANGTNGTLKQTFKYHK